MADRYRRSAQPVPPRQPLGPGNARANINSNSRKTGKAVEIVSSSPGANRPVDTNATSRIRSTSPSQSPGHNRVAAIVNESQRRSKRDSEISNASSTTSAGRKRTIGRWQLGRTIGQGGCSTVRLVRHIDTAQMGAVKIVSRKMAESVRAQSLANLAAAPEKSLMDLVAAGKVMPPPPPGLMREIAIMKLLDHPNIVHLYDVWENHNELYLIMEYVQGGELFHYVEECRGLDEKETVYIFRQIVAALLYCHRLHIHHRDLKPENILLDREKAQVKLVDFGMAALQPEGKLLTTACGSPHYAAPEVIKSRPYDGAKADVWSCGVILYVMLTGTTPFNYDMERNLHVMYQAIAAADYYMPPELGADAKDLLRKIFVPKPEKRITMDGIWDHPFLHKYDRAFGYEGDLAKKEAWMGLPPKLDEWSVEREEDIDKEILRNMRTLWHSVPQHILVKKLLSQQPNQEKYFYAALLKHREEHLENYINGADAASDYQHNKEDTADGPAAPHEKQKSQSSYSIMNNEHLRPSPSMPDVPQSESSYDPYRASQYRMNDNNASYTKVTVHRRGNSATIKKVPQGQLRHPAALRVEMLKKGNRQSVQISSPSLGKSAPKIGHRKSASRSSIVSKQSAKSTTNSVWPSSPPVAVAAHNASKRTVSFSHLRQQSSVSALTATFTPELQAKARQSQQVDAEAEAALVSSPAARAVITAHTRKSKTPSTATPRGRPRKSSVGTPGHYIRNEVRKISTELEKACEEAFNGSSFGSSEHTVFTEKHSPYNTPPSSASRDGREPYRPLPDVPNDTPNTFVAKTFEETRNKLVARSASEGQGNARLEEALAALDKIMPADVVDGERRVISAPEHKQVADINLLPIIKEEGGRQQSYDGRNSAYRSVTAPVPMKQEIPRFDPDSIRVVQPSSPSPASPSFFRKLSGGSASDANEHGGSKYLRPNDRMTRKKSTDSAVGLSGDDENANANDVIAKKKTSWFRRWNSTPAESEVKSGKQAIPASWQELDDRLAVPRMQPNVIKRDRPAPQPLILAETGKKPDSEFPMRMATGGTETKGLSKWFGSKKEKRTEEQKAMDAKGTADAALLCLPRPTEAKIVSATVPTSAHDTLFPGSPMSPITPGSASEPTRSWFARFLRLRPEHRVVCFSVPRGRARSEIYRLLREWQHHGIRDLVYFPQDNSITARVDKTNALGIKPVSFRIELFVVLQNGKKAGLSLARWTQVRGAASSFRKVVEIAEKILKERNVLVDDEAQWKELCEILN